MFQIQSKNLASFDDIIVFFADISKKSALFKDFRFQNGNVHNFLSFCRRTLVDPSNEAPFIAL